MKKWIMCLLWVAGFSSMAAAEESLPAALNDGAARLASLQALRARVDVERGKEEELALLQIEVERLKLELEKKKTIVELGRLSGAGDMPVGAPGMDGAAALALRYVFVSGGKKEAVFDVNGVEQRLEEGGKAGGFAVKSISADGVVCVDGKGTDILMAVPR
jgi:hypothetical protein